MCINEIFSLKGRNAFVTGATGYLGEQICFGLANAGAHVIVQGRNEVAVHALVQTIQGLGGTAEAAIFDLLNEKSTNSYFKNASFKKLNVLVNNAYSGVGGTIACSKDQNYRDSFEVGLVVVQRLFKLCTPLLLEANRLDKLASCINIASMYGHVAPDLGVYDTLQGSNPPFYGAVKAALIQWTKYAACEYGALGIRTNCISPGPFPSELVQADNPKFIEKLANKVPLGRIGIADEIKGPTLFLASPASSYVNGSNIVVDGGWTCW
ncbi:MAG: NAD(P)-dependent dehydrogenase (short-subunit alcohol dehydrogenase family) [Oleiphilaceae bacterium]|jgi:NAD(P)-dependent dehydrogenase (short-subunit alcohol dehydrogenase family)